MAESTPSPALASTADSTPYVPISWMAVAAISVAGVFVFVLLFAAWAAFAGKKPLVELYLLIFAAVGVVLSFAARRMIRNSEGTRTGEGLANVAWWISLIGGLGYFAYYAGVEYSIRYDAQKEVKTWIEAVKKGEVSRAFWQTRDPGQRSNLSPDGGDELQSLWRNEYVAFSKCDIVEQCKRNPNACEFIPGGLKDWTALPGGIKCSFAGVLKSPEGSVPVEISLRGVEAGAGAGADIVGRQWAIDFNPQGYFLEAKRTRTPYGWKIYELEASGYGFGEEMLRRTTLDPVQRAYVFQTAGHESDWDLWDTIRHTQFIPLPVLAGVPNPFTVLPFTANYRADLRNKFFKLLPGGGPQHSSGDAKLDPRDQFVNVWLNTGLHQTGSRLTGNEKFDGRSTLNVTDTAVEVAVPCELPLVGAGGVPAAARGRLIVACNEPEVLAELKKLRAEANPDKGDAAPQTADFQKRPFKWRIVRVESDMYPIPINPQGQGGRGGPGGM